jgi:hypothetical protein
MTDFRALIADDAFTDERLIQVYQAAYQPAWERGEWYGCHVDGLRAVYDLAAPAQPKSEGAVQWSEGICGDGAAILRDGVMVPIEEVVVSLNRAEQRTAQPEPEGASLAHEAYVAGEVAEVCEWLENHAAHLRKVQEIGALPESAIAELQEMLGRAATLLQQQQHLLGLACAELDAFMEQQAASLNRAEQRTAQPEPEGGGSIHGLEGEIVATIRAYASVEPQVGASRILHESDFGVVARAILQYITWRSC